MIYLDNASTTNKKPFSVKLAVKKAMSKKYCANPGRSSHKLSLNAERVIFETRKIVNDFFNVNCLEHIVFTSGCTEALNTAIMGTIKQGGNVIISSNEHNSVARPLKYLESQGKITLTILNTNEQGKITPKMLENVITDKTYLVVINHTSNVTGATQNLNALGKICKEHNIMFMVDAAQSAGHIKIDMQKDNIDILCTAGHKGLLALQGVGVLCFRENITIEPLKRGGTGSYGEMLLPPNNPPESLEAGTSPTPAIFSLNAGIKYVKKRFNKINNKIKCMTKYLIEQLTKMKEIKLYTMKNDLNGVVSFNVNSIPASEVVDFMNEKNICIRSGLHCAPLVHQKLGTKDIGGTIRVSISSFNKKREITRFIRFLQQFLIKNRK